jgi:chromosomal replication initiation ATPase DnaA
MTKIKPRVLMKRQDRIDYVIDGVCAFYKIPKNELTDCYAKSDIARLRKRLTVKILRDIADCSLKDIRFAFKHGDESNAWQIYDKITDDLNSDSSCHIQLKQEYNDILNFLQV